MNAADFLYSLYGGAGIGFLTIWTLPDKRTAYFPVSDIGQAAAYAESRFDNNDVYFGVGLRREPLSEKQRGGNGDVSAVTAFWSDIDVLGPAHKETALPPTEEAALEFLCGLPLKPSIVVSSGNGLHIYWQFAEPLAIITEAHRKNIGDALRGWQTYINHSAKERGWKLDNTSDLSRVLRVPGGINHKAAGSGRRCEVIAANEQRYSAQDFTAYIQAKTEIVPAYPKSSGTRTDILDTPSKTSEKSPNSEFSLPVGKAERIIDKCAFIRFCRDNARNLTEPQWYAMTSNLALCSDGAAVCHEFSKPYPKYNPNETDKKIQHALKERKPHTCEYIRNTIGFDCIGCAANCKSPISLAVITKAETVRNLLNAEIENYETLFNEEYLDAFAYAKERLPADYAQFKMKHKGKFSLRDLEACIRNFDINRQKALVNNVGAFGGEALTLNGIDLRGAVIPRKWTVSQDGVRRFTDSRNGTEEVIVCPDPVVVTRRLVNIDDGKERLELSFRKDGHWKAIIGCRTQVYNKASIISFGDEGLHVTSGTAAELVNYLSDYETANKSVIPRASSIGRLGWVDDTQFFPYALNEEILFEDDKGTAVLYKNLSEKGDYSAWKDMMIKLRENPIARFIISASFASPLLCKIGVRTFVIHLWHNSASGKSAALKAAISVWGNPLRIMGNGFTTVVGTEQLAGTLRNLPFGIDEKQSADERRLSLEHLIYVLGQGSGKIRGAKGGGNAEVAVWHNVVMLTGEEPITRNSSLDGIQTRTFEIYGKPVDNVDFAKEAHITSENNYGFAGAAFMRAVCGIMKNDRDYLLREYQRIAAEYKKRGLRNIHADYVAAVTLGDYLAEKLIFGNNAETALKEAYLCGEAVYALNENQLSADAVERAWDFIVGWLISNEGRFSCDASPYYGTKEKSQGGAYDEYFVIPQYLDTALENEGFSVKKTFQGLKERGFIETETESDGKTRTKRQHWIDGKKLRVYGFKLKSTDIQPLVGKEKNK